MTAGAITGRAGPNGLAIAYRNPAKTYPLHSRLSLFPPPLIPVLSQRRQILRVKVGTCETAGTLFFFLFCQNKPTSELSGVGRIDKTRRRFRVAPGRTRLPVRPLFLFRRLANIIICDSSRRFAIRTGTMDPPRWPTMSNVRASHVHAQRSWSRCTRRCGAGATECDSRNFCARPSSICAVRWRTEWKAAVPPVEPEE